jgi:hypothetical protein
MKRTVAISTLLLVAAIGAPPAARGQLTSRPDDRSADVVPLPTINGIPMRVRVLLPDAPAPPRGWPLIVYVAGDFTNRCANVNESPTRESWYTRRQMVEHGYAVLSFNARGYPAARHAGRNPTGTSGCDALEDAGDAIDDTGWDAGGPLDRGDLEGLIDWAVASYDPDRGGDDCATSASPCIDGERVGLFAYGLDALEALAMGVPDQSSEPGRSRVKAIVAIGYQELFLRNVAAISDDGAGAFRRLDLGLRPLVPDMHIGYLASHAHMDVGTRTMEILRSEYLGEALPQPAADWAGARALLDDDPAIDKVGDIAVPTFFVHALFDPEAYNVTATLAHGRLGADVKPEPNTESYLYLGACGTTYPQLGPGVTGPCDANASANATHLRDTIGAFFDTHVSGAPARPIGGKVFWTIPPARTPFANDAWTVAVDPDVGWPPEPDEHNGITTSTYCLGGDGSWLAGACDAVEQDPTPRAVANVVATLPFTDVCTPQKYALNEVASYTSGPAETEVTMLFLRADVSVASTSSRVQLYADLYTVDAAGTETRVWQGSAQIVPVKRDGAASTVYRFRFVPSGAAWTLARGDRLRLALASRAKVAAAFGTVHAQELVPATYTIHHADDHPAQLTIVWDLEPGVRAPTLAP